MAKRARQKNRTGNSKRPPAPSLGGAAATKLPSVNPGPLAAESDTSAKLQLVPNAASASEPPSSLGTLDTVESVPPASGAPSSARTSDAPPSLEAAPANTLADGTPSPISLDLAADRSAPVQVDEFEEAFFSSLPPGMHAPEHDDHEVDDARMARLHEPDVVARRDRMRRLVAWGLAACAAVFFLAVGRAALRGSDPAPTHAAAPVATPAPAVATPAPIKIEEPVAPTPAASVEAVAPVPEQHALAPSAAPAAAMASVAPVASVAAVAPVVEPVAPAASAAAATPAPPGGDAKALRAQAQRLLESGKANDAIPVALESTTVEPEHAGGWLLLGAAYQTRGRNAEARQAFLTCVKTAKRGPRGECAAMLR